MNSADLAAQAIIEVMKKGTAKTDRPHWSQEHQDTTTSTVACGMS
jgi:hypothetical protein